MKLNKIYHGDCLEIMPKIKDKSIDMILCDLPYGTTACSWDTIIPLKPLWEQYKRIIKDNGAIVLTASQPFTSKLVMSNLKWFKYEWVWNKKLAGNVFLAKSQPMKIHENILVFNSSKERYYPIKTNLDKVRSYKDKYGGGETFGKKGTGEKVHTTKGKLPKSIIEISNANRKGGVHPTQKPVALMEYLIKTYTNKGDLVLDNCIGSGTTAVACRNLGRNFIGIEIEKKYVDIANKRLAQQSLFEKAF